MSKNTPLRVFDGPHQPHEPFWTVKNTAAEPEIEFYGYISEYSWYEDDITPAKFKDDLNAAGSGGPVTIRMNSGGGDVFAASVIRSILMEYPGLVTVRIDGLAASAATVVATAGDVIRMQDTAYWMIHDPIALVYGNIELFKQMLDTLKTIKDGILDAYAVRTEMSREKLSKLMTAETWFSASEARDAGFVDEVIVEKKKKKSTDNMMQNMMQNAAIVNALRNYENVPAALLAKVERPAAKPSEPVVNEAAERLRAEVKLYL